MANQNKSVLITGGTSGIGFALARVFAEHHFNLVIVARKQEELLQAKLTLEQGYDITVQTIQKDLIAELAAHELHAELASKGIRIDILVNNAGFANYGKFQDISLEKDSAVMHLNMINLTLLTKLFLKDFLARNDGRILNVASTAAFQPGPFMSVYYATKAYVLFLGEAVAEELRATGVTITTLCPGPTKTAFQEKSAIKGTRLIKMGSPMGADAVALLAYRGLMRGSTIVIPGFQNKLLVQLLRIAPRKMTVKIVRWLQEPSR